MINDQNSWWCRYCLLFPGRCLTSRRLLSMLLMVVTIQIGCFSAAMDSCATTSKTLPLMDSDFSGCCRSNHVIDGRRSVLVTKNLFLQGVAADQTAPPRFAPEVSPLPDQCASPLQPESVLSRNRSLILGSLAFFFFLLSMGLLLFLLLTRGRSTQRLLLKQRQLLEDITGNLPAVVYQFYVNADGTYGLNYVNQKAADILELDVPLTSFFTAFTECIHPDDKARFFESIENAGKNKTPWHFEGRFVKPSGSQMWFSGDAAPHQNGGQTQFNGVIMDVTKRKWVEEKLRTSEQRMSQIINFLPDPTFVIDSDSKVIAWNRAMEKLTEVSAETILGKGNYEYALPFYGQRRPITIDLVRGWSSEIAEKYINIERKGEILFSETKDHYPLLNKGLFRNVAGPLYDEAGNLIGAIESIHDITSRRKALNALRAREELLVFFVTYTPAAVAMFDLKMNYLHYSQRWITDFNLPDEDLTGRCHYDVMGPIPEHWKEEHHRCLQGESIQKEEETFTRADGSVEWVRRTLYPWRTHEDKIGGIIILVELTTAKKRAEQIAKEAQDEIHKRQLFLEAVLYQAPDAIIVMDADHRVTDWNPGAEKIFGYKRSEILGKVLSEVVANNKSQAEVINNIRTVNSGQHLETFDAVRYRKDGTPIHVLVAGSPIVLGDQMVGAVAMYTDITALKKAEAEVKRNERMLRRIMDMVPSMIFVKNAQGRFLMANQAVADSYGIPVDSLVGKLQRDVHPDPEQVARYMADDWQTIQSGQALLKNEEPFMDHTGAIRWLEVSKLPCDLSDFGEPALVVLATDVTKRRETEARIQESETRYRMIFENTGTGTVLSEADMTLSMVNREFAQMVGYARKEIEGKMKWTDFIAPDDVEQLKAYHFARRKDPFNTPNQYECKLVDRAGRLKPMLLRARLIPGTQTSIGAFLDISDRKQTEEALVVANRMLRLVLDTIPVYVFWKDTNCRYLGCNQPFAENAGFSDPEALIGLDDYELVWYKHAPAYRRDDRAVMTTGQARLNFEEKQTTATGKTVWVQTSKVPMRDGQDNIIGLLGTFQDITENKRAREELQRLRNYLSNIIDSMPSVLIGVDDQMRVTQWNKQAEKQTGLPFKKAHNQPLESAYPRLADELGQIKTAIKDRKVNRNLKIPRQHQGGTQFEDITIFPLEADGAEGAVIRLDNVTEQVRMEEMMIQSEKMLSVGGLAAGMAHEINNPLAGILQNTAVLENRLFGDLPANHKVAEKVGIDLAALRQYLDMRSLPTMLENIRSSGNRAAAIVKNMLSFARKSDRVVSSHDLGTLLDQTIELAQTDYDMKKHYDFKQIQIIREYDQTVPPVPCESSKIQQVFLNILKNGAEAMADNADEKTSPMFVLRVKDDDAWVRVEIEDNGPGMDEPTRRRIFEPFFTTKPVGKGTGLGLSVSYFIITENHGGKMDAHVVDDGGTRFIIQLPKAGSS